MPKAHWRLALAVAGTLTVSTLATAHNAVAASDNNSPTKLMQAVTVDNVLRHEAALQDIANANGGTRESGTPGYEASLDYVMGKLKGAGYQVTKQPFLFPFFRELSPPELAQLSPDATTYTAGTDFATMTFSPAGDVTAATYPVDVTIPATPTPSSTSGCEAADFAGFPAGSIALIQRGTCTFRDKALNAAAAGASAVIVFNEGQPGRTAAVAGTLSNTGVPIPVIGASYAVGVDLADPAGTVVQLATHTESDIRTTWNVIAQTSTGRTDNVVMAGAHLDSRLEGPGINDNGSGSSGLLEVALQLAKTKPNNAVRFAWWGAEEFGLLGSTAYVNTLTPADRNNLALYLNFDMIASPNYFLGIYDGDNSDAVGAGPGPTGSAQIEDIFEAFFDSRGLPHEGTDFTGRSDYGPFIAVGIPAGGLFTGAEEVKTATQAARYGGTAGIAFDPCYHTACDTYANLNRTALDLNSDAIAYTIGHLVWDTSTINGVHSPGKSHGAGRSIYGSDPGAPATS